ncbi:hypothetical protein PVAP13_3KG373227, partial [Panicum virgatum]
RRSPTETSHTARPRPSTSTPPRPRAASLLSSTPLLYEVPPRPAWRGGGGGGAETHGDRPGLIDDRLDSTVPAVDLCSACPRVLTLYQKTSPLGAGEIKQHMYSRWLPDDINVSLPPTFSSHTIVNFLQKILQASKNLKLLWPFSAFSLCHVCL